MTGGTIGRVAILHGEVSRKYGMKFVYEKHPFQENSF